MRRDIPSQFSKHDSRSAPALPEPEPSGRRAPSGLNELLALSLLMFDRHDVDGVIQVLARSVGAVTRCQLVRVTFRRDRGWVSWPADQPAVSSLRRSARASVDDHGHSWTCTTNLPASWGSAGELVLRSPTRPDAEQLFVVERLGHLLGAALQDAELHERDHRRSVELDSANTELSRTLATLRQRQAVHEEFLHLAATGTELDLATALSGFTGCAVVLRDGFENETTRVALDVEVPPARAKAPLVAVIGGRPELGTVELVLPMSHRDDAEDADALRHASVALGLLRAHASAMSEMQNRLSRELLDDLVEGIPREVALDRAAAQGHDLRGRHDLVVSMWPSDDESRASERDVERLRTAMAHQQLPCLVTRAHGMVVVLAHQGIDLRRLYDDLCRAHGDVDGVIAKAELVSSPEHIPRAYEQAQRALTARRQSSDPRGFIAYSDLGVDRILALDGNASEVERLIDDWLGDLLSYDGGHGTDLVPTLASYLDLGGRYDDTAHALSIHRNTLRYRLGRISEISSHDLTDVETKLNLHLALRAWRLRRG